jgi:hypothetical protein
MKWRNIQVEGQTDGFFLIALATYRKWIFGQKEQVNCTYQNLFTCISLAHFDRVAHFDH